MPETLKKKSHSKKSPEKKSAADSDKNTTESIIIVEGNEAVANVAFRINEVIAIYPITPSSGMGELSDAWAVQNHKNIWDTTPTVIEMQSEAGAAGTVHGALQAGSLTTTYTASQGLLLMIPNMYKIAGELTPAVFHVAARTIATHALSIFGDQSDVMTVRTTGWAMTPSNSVQEAHDFACITQAASMRSRIPFVHFFDGFRVSHAIQKVQELSDGQLRTMITDEMLYEVRNRAMTPDKPVLRGTSQNPDVFFQSRERVNEYYERLPGIMQDQMDKFASLTGRAYKLFQYEGDPKAEKVIVIMGSGAEAVHETVEFLAEKGEKVGVLKVRLFRPFSSKHLIEALPDTLKTIAVMDKTKEPGAIGEPLLMDIIGAFHENNEYNFKNFKNKVCIIGGRYGLSSKEFNAAMIKGIFDEMGKPEPKRRFTVGIHDDVTHLSIDFDPAFSVEQNGTFRGVFYGLGSDGTVSANKNSIKIIGEATDFNTQGYFVYDSKKAGAVTISHLRFGKHKIQSSYLINASKFVACHQYNLVKRFDMLDSAIPGAVFLLNSPYDADSVWSHLPGKLQETIIRKKIKFYVVDAYKVAREAGMGSRINTIMQTCFFSIADILPKHEAIKAIKDAIRKTYSKKGEELVQKNFEAVDKAVANLFEVTVPAAPNEKTWEVSVISPKAPEFVRNFIGNIIEGKGDLLPVSMMPVDGTYPLSTTQWEKANIAEEIPVWYEDLCIQCGKCSIVCPHACIRIKAYDKKFLKDAPDSFKHMEMIGKDFPENSVYTIQVAPEDCTGCAICYEICPGIDKQNPEKRSLMMEPVAPIKEQEIENWDYFLALPEVDRSLIKQDSVKGSQYLQPLFEFSGACAGCGETPYIKLATQLFGDRMLIANSTGCSSIYGGNLPTTPYSTNHEGRGPTWSNSLFEDTAEFGLGFRLTVDQQRDHAKEILKELAAEIGDSLSDELLNSRQENEAEIFKQRERVAALKQKLHHVNSIKARLLEKICDYLVKKSVWVFGGDGWAYDIGFSGVDHIMATGHNVNLLVMDTEVYSNTGGQMSKATPLGAFAKFASSGKSIIKKDLGMQMINYGNVYVAQIAMGANDNQTVKAFAEAEAFDGPSLIIAYSNCIEHGYDQRHGMTQMKLAVDSGYWPLFRYNPDYAKQGKPMFRLDSKDPKIPLEDFLYNENRFAILKKTEPELARKYLAEAKIAIAERWHKYKAFAAGMESLAKSKPEK
ncbi:MAG: pyruvate:ferredoxin (flavodoxin) oxidoreductase [Spirochaetia bacterium]|nr:pyruvate:ferredoxin (flavodoxin) oxidoreductase [Spirochaetia bacterium]